MFEIWIRLYKKFEYKNIINKYIVSVVEDGKNIVIKMEIINEYIKVVRL